MMRFLELQFLERSDSVRFLNHSRLLPQKWLKPDDKGTASNLNEATRYRYEYFKVNVDSSEEN
ncbi:16531_t:CDS:2 [Rhizophagus irregularis]|nr:16531_t:CDS:2 [Rhizophagus irregularis]